MELNEQIDHSARRARLQSDIAELTARLSPEARHLVATELMPQIMQSEEPPLLAEMFHVDYRRVPVGVRDFVNDPYYLGSTLHEHLFEQILDDLEELFDGEHSEVLLAGGIGWGKSRFAEVGQAYDLYRVSCLRNPAAAYGLIPNSTLAFLNVSVTQKQAIRIIFKGMFDIIKQSPYFREEFPYEPNLTTEIRFPNGVTCYPVASNETSMLGEGVFSAAFDEMNFMPVIDNSKRSPDLSTYDAAQKLYTRLSRRLRSRMNQRGRLPGHLWMVSSANYPNDFTERKMAEAKNDKNIFVRNYAAWETRPRSVYMPETFKVEVGDATKLSRVLDGTETDVNESKIIEVPMDFHNDFSKDPEGSVRDIAGKAVLTIRPFIQRRDLIQKMFQMGKEAGLQHPFEKFDVTLQDTSEFMDIYKLHWIESAQGGRIVKRIHPGPYFAHVDLAKRTAGGIAIGHVIGTVKVDRGIGNDLHVEERPMIRADILLRIVPPPHGEILAANVRGLFYALTKLGCEFGLITYDSYGSMESLQILTSQGFKVENYSLDTSMDGYETAKQALYESRIMAYHQPMLEQELLNLMVDDKKKKIDHPPRGSKDLSDAWAGMVEHCERNFVAASNEAYMPTEGRVDTDESIMERLERGEVITEEEFDQL